MKSQSTNNRENESKNIEKGIESDNIKSKQSFYLCFGRGLPEIRRVEKRLNP